MVNTPEAGQAQDSLQRNEVEQALDQNIQAKLAELKGKTLSSTVDKATINELVHLSIVEATCSDGKQPNENMPYNDLLFDTYLEAKGQNGLSSVVEALMNACVEEVHQQYTDGREYELSGAVLKIVADAGLSDIPCNSPENTSLGSSDGQYPEVKTLCGDTTGISLQEMSDFVMYQKDQGYKYGKVQLTLHWPVIARNARELENKLLEQNDDSKGFGTSDHITYTPDLFPVKVPSRGWGLVSVSVDNMGNRQVVVLDPCSVFGTQLKQAIISFNGKLGGSENCVKFIRGNSEQSAPLTCGDIVKSAIERLISEH